MNNSSVFSNAILNWFRENGRALPWRETKDPYAIWLSEIIMQQTRIAQGREYWQRFMQAYPTVDDLAAASEDEVLKLWQGLGYYSRARNLHAAAQQIVALGHFPHTLDGIKALKGVGDYTAAAIGSIAFDLPAAVVDGNVYRVLSRYFGISTPINTTQGKKEFAALAQSLLPEASAERIRPNEFGMELSPVSAYNQAIMDFGAIQCTPQSPGCLLCPLADTCEALRSGRIDQLPVKQKKLKIKTRHLCYIYIRCKQAGSASPLVALHRRGEGDIWQGLWEPFNASLPDDSQPAGLADIQRLLHLSSLDGLRLLAHDVKHVLTHRILLADFYLLDADVRPVLPPDYLWVSEADIADYAVPRLIELLLNRTLILEKV